VCQHTGESREWSLYWTARGQPVPCRLVPVLAAWADLDERESAADIEPRHPILTDPVFRIDPVLARFLARSRFTWLAEGTREAYAKDYRLFFSFLWQRGKYWHEADPDDLLDWEAWRRRGQQPGRRISGSKWQRELAALRLLYEWAEEREHIARSPVLVHAVRLRDGGTAMAADQAPRDVRCSDVKWVTPRTYRLWRDVGLLGYDPGGQPDPSWRGRNDGRNAAFTDLLFSSGLRLREGGCLLTPEVPHAVAGHSYYEGSVAGAVAKRRERMFYASAAALRRVAGYVATTRAEAVRRARRHRRYDQVPGKLIVTKVGHGARRKLRWRDDQGRAGEAPVGAIGPDERMRLFTETEDGLEPLWLWLTEGGTPMAYQSWEKVFDAANARVAAVFAAATRQDGRRRTAIACSPHMMRHSFALHMLVALHHALDRRFGLTPEERKHFRQVYGDPWVLVRDLLGHRSEQTTRLVYLEPLSGLQVRSMLDHDEDLETLLSRVAASSRLVIDAGPAGEDPP
jgi:site-specific recombinase XerD